MVILFCWYIFGNTVFDRPRVNRCLCHCETCSVWSIILSWIDLRTNNACKLLNFTIKIHALSSTFFYRKILFSDEAHFWLNGYVNKQNCRIWNEDQPEALQVLPMHPEKVTVWCGLWAGGIIRPYFFKGDDGRNVTVNGERYRMMIDDFFFTQNGRIGRAWHVVSTRRCFLSKDIYFRNG